MGDPAKKSGFFVKLLGAAYTRMRFIHGTKLKMIENGNVLFTIMQILIKTIKFNFRIFE